MFHAKEGLYFERQIDGSVKVVLKRAYEGNPWIVNGKKIVPEVPPIEILLGPLTWASAVAAVSKRGQVTEVIEEALRLHGKAETSKCKSQGKTEGGGESPNG